MNPESKEIYLSQLKKSKEFSPLKRMNAKTEKQINTITETPNIESDAESDDSYFVGDTSKNPTVNAAGAYAL